MIISFANDDPKIESNFLDKYKSNKPLLKQYFKTLELLEKAPPFVNSLKKHPYRGKHKNLYIVYINKDYRIFFTYDENDIDQNITIASILSHNNAY